MLLDRPLASARTVGSMTTRERQAGQATNLADASPRTGPRAVAPAMNSARRKTLWFSKDDLVTRRFSVAKNLLVFQRAVGRLNHSRRNLHPRLAIGRRWGDYRHRPSLKRCVQVVHRGLSATVRRSFWEAAGAVLRKSSSRSHNGRRRHLDRAKRIQSVLLQHAPGRESRPKIDPGLTRRERGTLDLGSGVVLGALGLGVQFGRWPAWTALIAVGGYLTWVVIYSEATVQAKRLRSANPAWPLPRARSEETAAAPAQE